MILKKLFCKLKEKRGITGADVAAAVSVIVLTVGIVTAIYVNTLNKSKDNIRYANAVRIATNIMENIQKQPFEYLTSTVKDSGTVIQKGNGRKIFETKIPSGFEVTVTAQKGTDEIDVAREVIVAVKYKSNNTYKTISLSSVKEKELIDMTNNPDFSLIPGYNPNDGTKYYYPVVKDETNSSYKVTSTEDINWFDYEEGKYALVCVSSSNINVGETASADVYVWIPRFVVDSSKTDASAIQFLYGSSDYKITFNSYSGTKDLFAYGLSITEEGVPATFDSGFTYSGFQSRRWIFWSMV